MRALVALSLLAALGTLLGQDKKAKTAKPPDLEILQVTAQRLENAIMLDGRVRNCGLKSIKGLVLIFDFFAPNRVPIGTRKGPIDQELLEPGDEADFRLQLPAPPRAVEFQVSAEDRSKRELNAVKTGPFTIE
jgi:hypothetical protein